MGKEPARFGAPITIDLGGRGVRDLASWRGRYLVLAGDSQDARRAELHVWDGAARHELVASDFGELNPEVIFSPGESDRLLLLSDDGTEPVAGKECKRLKDPRQKQFRGLWLKGPKLAQ
jgi:hypothetical protein